jgi:BirA family biotin operon repressor/biotin-[acetyl-CoA-carboxylase] ligase
MILHTDNISWAEKFFNIKSGWQPITPAGNHSVQDLLQKNLFTSAHVYSGQLPEQSLWDYAYIVDYAPQSQFNVLTAVLKNHSFQEGILCLAKSGANFRGYRDRKWQTLDGNLHISMFLNPQQVVPHFNIGFTILATVAIIETLDCLSGLENKSSVKWVNDIIIGDSKVGGVLTQTQTKGDKVTGVFLGIGLNVESTPQIEQDLMVPHASCLKDFVNEKSAFNEATVLELLLEKLSVNYKLLLSGSYNQILSEYIKRSLVIGKKVEIYSDPVDGSTQKTHEGTVRKIGENLELYLAEYDKPVRSGRLRLAAY